VPWSWSCRRRCPRRTVDPVASYTDHRALGILHQRTDCGHRTTQSRKPPPGAVYRIGLPSGATPMGRTAPLLQSVHDGRDDGLQEQWTANKKLTEHVARRGSRRHWDRRQCPESGTEPDGTGVLGMRRDAPCRIPPSAPFLMSNVLSKPLAGRRPVRRVEGLAHISKTMASSSGDVRLYPSLRRQNPVYRSYRRPRGA
jgi:hypothetical protein